MHFVYLIRFIVLPRLVSGSSVLESYVVDNEWIAQISEMKATHKKGPRCICPRTCILVWRLPEPLDNTGQHWEFQILYIVSLNFLNSSLWH